MQILHSLLITHHFGRRYSFCCTFPILFQPIKAESDGGRYPPPCPVEPGLSSPRSTEGFAEADRSAFRAATVRPARGSSLLYVTHSISFSLFRLPASEIQIKKERELIDRKRELSNIQQGILNFEVKWVEHNVYSWCDCFLPEIQYSLFDVRHWSARFLDD